MIIVLVSQLFDGSQRCYPLPTVATIRHYAVESIIQLDLVDKIAPHTPNGLDHTAFVGAACHILFVFVGDACDNMRLLHSAKKPAKTWQGFIFCEAVTVGYCITFIVWRNANRVNSNGLNCGHRKFLRLFWVICGLGSGPTLVLASVNQPEDSVAFSKVYHCANEEVTMPQPCGNGRHTSLLLELPVAKSACAMLTPLIICDRGASHS